MIKKRPLFVCCLIILLITIIELLWAGGYRVVTPSAHSIFMDGMEKQVLLQGEVFQKSVTDKTQILYLKQNSITYQNKSFYESKIIVYDKFFLQVKIGQKVQVRGTVKVFDRAHNPGNFDQSQYYARQKIYGALFVDEIIQVTGEENRWKEMLYQVKQQWKQQLVATLGEENGTVLAAILLNEKREMDLDLKELYQKNGIGHILAISGLHISFVGLSIYKLLRKMGCPYLICGMVSAGVLFGYVSMIGVTVSVLRAGIMFLLRVGADVTGRVYDQLTALCLAAAITVRLQPLYLTDGGFYLSYGAILGITWCLPAMRRIGFWKRKWMKAIGAGVAIQCMTVPIMLYFYYELATYSFVLNLLVIPLMSYILGLGFVGSLLFLVWKPVGVFALSISGYLLGKITWITEQISHLPGATIVFGQPKIWQLVLYYSMLGAILFWINWKWEKRPIARWRLVCCMLGVSCLFFTGHGTNGKTVVTMLDVGQGDGLCVRSPKGKTYFIDGGSSDVKEVGRYRIEPYLKSQGIARVQYAFVSHGDADHYSGIEELLQRQQQGVRIEQLVLPAVYQKDPALLALAALAQQNGTRVCVMQRGMSLSEKSFRLTCIQPGEDFKGEIGNASSMILDLRDRNFRMLFTGDVEGEGEKLLEEELLEEACTVLKAAHHGSKFSTQQSFLEKLHPQVALISAGRKNRYGHPHRETVERLRQMHCSIYSTQKYGAVTVESDGKQVRVHGYH